MSAQTTSTRSTVGLTALGTVLALALFAMVNYLSIRHYKRWDWTTQGLYTLSGRTVQVLHQLPARVEIDVFLSESEQGFAELKELVERYRAVKNSLVVHYIDPDRQPEEYQKYAQRFDLQAGVTQAGTVISDVAAVAAFRDKKWSIARNDLISIDPESLGANGASEPRIDVKAEQALTGALVQVTSGRATRICVTQGHGEWTLDDAQSRSLGAFRDELHRDNIEMTSIDTLSNAHVGQGCDAVFVVSPVQPFNEQEQKALHDYVTGGGSLLVAADPVIDHDSFRPTGLENALAEFGVALRADQVVETDGGHRFGGNEGFPEFMANDFGPIPHHPTTDLLAKGGGRIVFNVARSVTPDASKHASVLVQTTAQAHVRTTISETGEATRSGPIVLGAAVSLKTPTADDATSPVTSPGSRVAVLGDADLFDPRLLGSEFTMNYAFLSSLTGWLTQREALISIPPKKMNARPAVLTEDDLAGLAFRVLVLLPLSVMLAGFAVWWQRRS